MTDQTVLRSSRVAVFGLGYVGCVTAACLAHLGHKVVGVDTDCGKVSKISAGRAPFHEPGLDEIIGVQVENGALVATTSGAAALMEAETAMICIGTPSEPNGNTDLQQLRAVAEEIGAWIAKHPKRLVVAVRSTVFPGTCEEIVAPLVGTAPNISVVSNPEFMREGSAVADFLDPGLLVVGGSDRSAVRQVAGLYAKLPIPASLVSLRTAEMIKYACNAFHATKISFANEIGALSDSLGVDSHEVMGTLCRDTRLNISAAYMKPGFAFGGSCLPKDLRALNYRASGLDLKLPMLNSIVTSNEEHLRRAIERALGIQARRIGIIGLAFKENTDDLRESPLVTLLENLLGKGRDVRVWDPHIHLDSIYGSNRTFITDAIPHIERIMETKLEGILNWADHLLLTRHPGETIAGQIANSKLPVTTLEHGP